ncbi:hypothetical protein [Catenulispora pinisilvae]|uniref:hypothetical protein n=1 Tax=Catenulispora pinisilvae TaxID=2705253 RepID=UPI00189238CD|nr:hypothetical protein [Catenulispora pinisilvae]
MSSLTRWILDLKAAVENGDRPYFPVRRLLVPGLEPLHGDGFMRFQRIGPVYRPGMPPESMSVVQWCAAGQPGDHLKDSELGASIGTVLSLLLDRRIEVLEEVPLSMEGAQQTTFVGFNNVFDRRLSSPFEAAGLDARIRDLLSQLVSLAEDDQATLTAAMDLHYGATLLFEKDLAAAYTLIVAGLEVMSRQYGEPPTNWEAWEQARSWDKFARAQGLSDVQAEALRAKLMKSQYLRLKETFVNYVAESLEDGFWEQEWREWIYDVRMPEGVYGEGGSWAVEKHIRDFVTQDRGELCGGLRKTYDARSGFVHSGSRAISTANEIYGLVRHASADRPLPYSVLRSMLAELIKQEVRDRATGFELPEIVMSNDPPPAA